VERLDDSGSALDEVRALHQQLTKARTTVEALELARLNRALHFAIYQSGSQTITEHIGSLWRLLPTTATLWDRPEVTEVLVAQHGNIITAMADRDAGAAAAFMYEHVMTAGRVREERADG
jgi:DNA-binding GntR family transcriptional regulator